MFTLQHRCEYSRINILLVIPSPAKLRRGYSNATVRPSIAFLVNTVVNMVQWISTKLDTQVILPKIWHPIDFQDQRSRSQLNFEFFRGLSARGYAMLCVALVQELFPNKRPQGAKSLGFFPFFLWIVYKIYWLLCELLLVTNMRYCLLTVIIGVFYDRSCIFFIFLQKMANYICGERTVTVFCLTDQLVLKSGCHFV